MIIEGQIAPAPGEGSPEAMAALAPLLGNKNIVLVFYRGYWCLFCQVQMGLLARKYELIRKCDAEIVAVSVDHREESERFARRFKLPFKFASDAGMALSRAYGVKEAKGNPIEWIDRQIFKDNYFEPAMFIIDKKGVVRFSHVGAHALSRPRNKTLLKVLEKISREEP
ncbi:MAG: AhpC/TSA family protein [Nitrospirae bacterium]|nr:AhpC/TSA family protein [Nitrospirota bacterium]